MIEIELMWVGGFEGYHLIARDKEQWPVKNSETGQYCLKMEYAEGLREPNYPVPAIPIECNIGAASVFFWWSSSKYKDYPKECKVIWKR